MSKLTNEIQDKIDRAKLALGRFEQVAGIDEKTSEVLLAHQLSVTARAEAKRLKEGFASKGAQGQLDLLDLEIEAALKRCMSNN